MLLFISTKLWEFQVMDEIFATSSPHFQFNLERKHGLLNLVTRTFYDILLLGILYSVANVNGAEHFHVPNTIFSLVFSIWYFRTGNNLNAYMLLILQFVMWNTPLGELRWQQWGNSISENIQNHRVLLSGLLDKCHQLCIMYYTYMF